MFFLDDGISIPSEYNSYLVPLSAPKLYASIEDCKEKDKVLLIDMIAVNFQFFRCIYWLIMKHRMLFVYGMHMPSHHRRNVSHLIILKKVLVFILFLMTSYFLVINVNKTVICNNIVFCCVM